MSHVADEPLPPKTGTYPSSSVPNHDCVAYDTKFCAGNGYNTDDRVETAMLPGTAAWDLCGSACTEEVSTGMVCLWEAVSSLQSVCAGTFTYNSSTAVKSANAENLQESNPNALATLWGCDEHAVCLACGGQSKVSAATQ